MLQIEAAELVCIDTTKIYASCCKKVLREHDGYLDISFIFDPDEPYHMESDVLTFTCTVIDREPYNDEGMQVITIEIDYQLRASLVQHGSAVGSSVFHDVFQLQLLLYAPSGTRVDCSTHTVVQYCESMVTSFKYEELYGHQVLVGAFFDSYVLVSIILESMAEVSLLIPSSGFCPPGEECEEATEWRGGPVGQ